MRRSLVVVVLVSTLTSLFGGCGWIQSLRREVEDEEGSQQRQLQVADFDYYKDPANRNAPPPPANVMDARGSEIAGTPVDLSGTRARHLRTTAANFAADAQKNENSLWAESGQTNYLFAQNKLKMPGDLLTVVIEDGLRKDMVDSVRKLLPPDLKDQEIVVPGLSKDQPADEPGKAPGATGAPSAGAEPGSSDIMTAEVLERYPNGNLRIRGLKRVPFKRRVRDIQVLSIVKSADVDERDTVKSSKFFEQRVDLF